MDKFEPLKSREKKAKKRTKKHQVRREQYYVGDIVEVEEGGDCSSWRATVVAVKGMEEYDKRNYLDPGVLVLHDSHRVPIYVPMERLRIISRNGNSDVGRQIYELTRQLCYLKHGLDCDKCMHSIDTHTYRPRDDFKWQAGEKITVTEGYLYQKRKKAKHKKRPSRPKARRSSN